MTLTSQLHSIIFHAVHLAATFVMTICSYWSSFTSKVQFQNSTKSLDMLPTGYFTVPTLDAFNGLKTPLHLGLLLLEDTYCLATLGLVISLVYSIGTRHISIYSKHGLKSIDVRHLQAVICERLNTGDANDINISNILDDGQRSCKLGKGDQRATDTSLNLYLVGPNEGRNMLVDITKQLAEEVKQGKTALRSITTDFIDKRLQGLTKCPDPDLVLTFGSVPSYCGYLPWQLRLTEIISLPSLSKFSPALLKDALFKFSKIERRFGK